MAIINNNPQTEVTTSYNKFTGLCTFTIQAVNPNLKKMKELGLYVSDKMEEPTTDRNIGGNDYKVITLAGLLVAFVDGKQYDQPFSFDILMEQGEWLSKATEGNKCFINQLGKTTWATSVEQAISRNKKQMADYVEKSGKEASFMDLGTNLRPSFKGERQLIELIVKACKVKYDLTNNVTLDAKTFSKEWYKEIETALVGNSVQLVMGIQEKDGKFYQKVAVQSLNECFLMEGQKASDYFIKKFLENNVDNTTNLPILTIANKDLSAKIFVPNHNTFTPETSEVDGNNNPQDTDLPF